MIILKSGFSFSLFLINAVKQQGATVGAKLILTQRALRLALTNNKSICFVAPRIIGILQVVAFTVLPQLHELKYFLRFRKNECNSKRGIIPSLGFVSLILLVHKLGQVTEDKALGLETKLTYTYSFHSRIKTDSSFVHYYNSY